MPSKLTPPMDPLGRQRLAPSPPWVQADPRACSTEVRAPVGDAAGTTSNIERFDPADIVSSILISGGPGIPGVVGAATICVLDELVPGIGIPGVGAAVPTGNGGTTGAALEGAAACATDGAIVVADPCCTAVWSKPKSASMASAVGSPPATSKC